MTRRDITITLIAFCLLCPIFVVIPTDDGPMWGYAYKAIIAICNYLGV